MEEEEEEREEEDVKIKQEKDWEAKVEAGVGSECKQEKVPQLPIGR